MVGSHSDDFDWGDLVAILHNNPAATFRCIITSWLSVFSDTDPTLTQSYNIQSQALTHRHTEQHTYLSSWKLTHCKRTSFDHLILGACAPCIHRKPCLSQIEETHILYTHSTKSRCWEKWYPPDGLLHRTIWSVVLGNSLEKGRSLQKKKRKEKYLAGDWMNHLSITSSLSLSDQSDWCILWCCQSPIEKTCWDMSKNKFFFVEKGFSDVPFLFQ